MPDRHRLLKRQLKKFFGDTENVPQNILPFLEAINQSYIHHESDRNLIERTMEISSKELTASNKQLLHESKKQQMLIDTLKESLQSIASTEVIFDDDDLLKMADLLRTEIQQRKFAESQIAASEEKYRGIIENMDLGMLETDSQGIVVNAYPRFLKLTGYTAEDLIGKDPKQILVNKNQRDAMRNQEVSRRNGEFGVYEIKLIKKNGEEMWAIVSGAPIFNENHEVTGTLGIHFDISHRKKIESDLELAKSEAEYLLDSKALFLANISHEIRTPMNAILGMASLINETRLNGSQKLYLNAINSSAKDLMVIIDDVLDMSKIKSGKFNVEIIDLDIDQMLANIHQSLSFKAKEKGIYFDYKRDASINKYLQGDPGRLSQVLNNLISNAIKFTTKGGIDVNIELIETTAGHDKLHFSVHDTGVGIDAEKLKSIFRSFTQEDETITRKYGGTGLGLSIATQLVEIFGGTLDVKSKKGKGSIFSFTILMPHGQAPPVKKKIIHTKKDLNGMRILLVEDNEVNQFLTVTVLAKWNTIVKTSLNGLEALEALKKDKFDLILMDMQMPEMDGIQATKLIRQDLKLQLPIVALTANAIKGEKNKCFEAGMNDYLSKPFDHDELYSKLIAFNTLGKSTKFAKKTSKAKQKKKASHARFSLDRLLDMYKGETQFVKRTMKIFLEQFNLDMAELTKHFEQGEFDQVYQLAHKIKPNIDLFEIHELQGVVQMIEQHAVNGLTEDLGDNINTLTIVMEEVSKEMQASLDQ